MKKNILNNTIKNIIILLIIIYLLYVIIFKFDNEKNKELFSGQSIKDLNFEYSGGKTYKLIRDTITKTIGKSTSIEIATDSDDSNKKFKINQRNVPIGSIRYFNHNNQDLEENSGWLLCDGRNLSEDESIKYPELFRLLNNRDLRDGDTITLPNLTGRTIIGKRNERPNSRSPDINPLSSRKIFMDKVNNNHFTRLDKSGLSGNTQLQANDLGVENAVNIIDGSPSEGIIYRNGNTGGIDFCPGDDDNREQAKPDTSDNAIKFCDELSNMPPYISLYPYIKAKLVDYKLNIVFNPTTTTATTTTTQP